jgi:hypothetical protein
MTCPFARDDGAYVLGALSPGERLRFEQHLSGCEACSRSVRELAGLPGLLARVDAGVVDGIGEPDPPPPDTLLPALAARVRRRRRRTRTTAAAAAAAGVVVAGVLGATLPSVVGDRDAGGSDVTAVEGLPMEPVGAVPVEASLSLEPVAWGTRLGLECRYDPDGFDLPPAVDYWLVLHTRDGHTEELGSWRSLDGATMRLSAATAAERDEIESIEVLAPGGRVVLRLTV